MSQRVIIRWTEGRRVWYVATTWSEGACTWTAEVPHAARLSRDEANELVEWYESRRSPGVFEVFPAEHPELKCGVSEGGAA